jgi:hypothetical protein
MGALNFIFHNSAAGLIDLGTIVSIFVVVGVICCRGFYFSDASNTDRIKKPNVSLKYINVPFSW